MSDKQQGTVKWFNGGRGYGFIVCDTDYTKEVFVHFSSIEMEGYKILNEGDRVEFNVADGKKGPQAVNVMKL